MSSTRWMWRTVGLGALASTLICAGGFAYAVNRIMYPPAGSFNNEVVTPAPGAPAPAETEPGSGAATGLDWTSKSQIRIVAWGDSLTAGTGDLTGKGYVRGVRDKLEKQLDKPVFVYNNFAIPGYRTSDLLKDWEAKADIAKSMGEADLILLTAGGNDLFLGGQGLFTQGQTATGQPQASGQSDVPGQPAQTEAGTGKQGGQSPQASEGMEFSEGFNPQAAADRIPEAAKRLEELFDKVSKANPKARVLYIGLYHPFLDLDPDRAGAPIVQRWNTAAFDIASRYPNITVVPTYDLFELQGTRFLYTDHFHPNQQGYERIADRIAQILK